MMTFRLTSLLLLHVYLLRISNGELHQIVPSEFIPAREVPIVLSFQDPKYRIDLYPVDAPFTVGQDQEIIPMTDVNGLKYACALPQPPVPRGPETDEGQQNGSSIGLTTDGRGTRKTPDELLDGLRETCFQKPEEWWVYELCYHGAFKQFHVDTANKKLQVTQEFILGKFDKQATVDLHLNSQDVFLQKDPRSQSAAQRYHAHLYTNGTVCDLTNEPRTTEVRFVCSKTGKVGIHSVKESPSCKYTVIFYVPMLCNHPLFQEEQSPWVVIHCNELASKSDGVEEDDVQSNSPIPMSDS